MSSNSNQSYCKNHPQQKSGYYLNDQPWVRFCKNCALNAALCGKKIQKQLTKNQFNKKMTVISYINQLKNCANLMEQNSCFFSAIQHFLREEAKPIENALNQIQAKLKLLNRQKQSLQQHYQKQIGQRISQYLQKQTKIGINLSEIKKQIQNIECNFSNLIEEQNNNKFQSNLNRWSQKLIINKRQILNTNQFEDIKRNFNIKIQELYQKFQNFQNHHFRVDLFKNSLQKLNKYFNEQPEQVLTPIEANSFLSNSCVETSLTDKKQNKKYPSLKLKSQSKRKSIPHQTTANFYSNSNSFRSIQFKVGEPVTKIRKC